MKGENDLTPEEVKSVKKYQQKLMMAQDAPLEYPDAVPLVLHYKEGQPTKNVITLAEGYNITLQFFDNMGNPYPIDHYKIGNENYFSALFYTPKKKSVTKETDTRPFNASRYSPDNLKEKQAEESKVAEIKQAEPVSATQKSTIVLSTNSQWARTNITIWLVGKTTPLQLTLISSTHKYNNPAYINVEGMSPESLGKVEVSSDIQGMGDSPTQAMLDFLNGIKAHGSKNLDIGLSDSMAWSYCNYYYIRTNKDILSPPYLKKLSMPSGYSVYKLPKQNTVAVSDHGRYRVVGINPVVTAEDYDGDLNND